MNLVQLIDVRFRA